MRVWCWLALLIVGPGYGQSRVTIDEAQLRVIRKDGATVVAVPVVHTGQVPLGVTLEVAWLTPKDVVAQQASREAMIVPGSSTVEIALPSEELSLWTRLRYRVTPSSTAAREFAPIAGMVALPQVAAHVFQLQVSQAGIARRGLPLTVHAQAVHPISRRPVAGVDWRAVLVAGEARVRPRETRPMDGGIREFVFDLPEGDDFSIGVEATGDGFQQQATLALSLSGRPSARLQTDKPIYQPGQKLQVRALVRDAQGRAFADAPVTLRIEDESGERVHTAKLTASKFGIVSDSWEVPSSASLGEYRLTVWQGELLGEHVVRVSRYDLPAFRVKATPERTAYLPKEPVRVKVEGAYLFGKPVPRGRVKIARADSDEPEVEGTAGDDGVFTAVLDVAEAGNQLALSGYLRFQDLHYVATYQDLLSGRTEQRRFDVRLSREPLHVYLVRGRNGEGYVTVSYADGRPAVATVGVRVGAGTATRSLTTNRYGVAKLENAVTGWMTVRATDAAGLTGSRTERWLGSTPGELRWEPGRTLYRAGEAATLQLASAASRPGDEFVLVHAIADGRRVASRVAHMVNHRAAVTFPYQNDFRRTVVFAISGDPATKAVVYPDGSDLKLQVTSERTAYRPGEAAALRVAVTSLDAKPVPAAIGLAVVDAAVLERARTDEEFGRRSWFSCAFCLDGSESEIGGVRLNDLYARQPAAFSAELDLVAEVLTAQASSLVAEETAEALGRVPAFASVNKQMDDLQTQMDRHYGQTLEFPEDFASFDRIAAGRLKTDPWGQPWTIRFGVEAENRFVQIRSHGPDKTPDSADDFEVTTIRRAYFLPLRQVIREILGSQVDYPHDEAEFAALLRSRGLLWESLLDPWGSPYQAAVRLLGIRRVIVIRSWGPDRLGDTEDDFPVETFHGTYFRRENEAIAKAVRARDPGPGTAAEFAEALRAAGIELGNLRDPWKRPFRLTSQVSSSYADRVSRITEQTFGGPSRQGVVSVPVTRKFVTFSLVSDGPDGVKGNTDDFIASAVPVLLAEEPAASGAPTATPPMAGSALRPTGAGKIAGLVTDASGARVPNAKLSLEGAGRSYVAVSDAEGIFYFAAVPPGLYTVTVECAGFQKYVLSRVPVSADRTTDINFELQVGSVAEAVEVSGQLMPLQTQQASVSVTSSPAGTPRVREYFPETLLWLPEVLTDAAGSTRVDLKLADSVTTWKIAAVASTLDGRMVEAEAELRAFQPFFLELQPPMVLTDGDRVTVPVTVRNYQARAETIAVNLPPDAGLVNLGAATARVTVPANGAANVGFSLEARGARERARMRVVARGTREQDAIEKWIRVHPDGREVTRTFGDLVAGRAEFAVSIPLEAIAGATRAELRLYPNLASLLLESAEALLRTPHGCAEQTISAAYANLIAWRFARAAGVTNALVESRARGHVRSGTQQLAGFRAADGGIAYWRDHQPDLAVTAHALSFLLDASAFVPVEREDVESLIRWLESRLVQGEAIGDSAAILAARASAAAKRGGYAVSAAALGGVYQRLAKASDQTAEPYLVANFILAAIDSGDEALVGDAVPRLLRQARPERGGAYWELQRNSAFFGWGTVGRYEATGLVVSALAAWGRKHPAPEIDTAVRQGLYFLLRGRGDQGTWHSTQATLRAMQALTGALTSSSLALGTASGRTARVRVNGGAIRSVALPSDPNATDPVLVEVALPAGESAISIEPVDAGVPTNGPLNLLAALTVTHWAPWAEPAASPELRLSVEHDRTSAKVGERIRCRVSAERVGFRGYGMMLAEIGLPPGADVDRASLEAAGVNHYEIHPDRVVLYLWPKAGGVSVEFSFVPRLAMTAKSAPSVLYDFNNSEARTEVRPVMWNIQ